LKILKKKLNLFKLITKDDIKDMYDKFKKIVKGMKDLQKEFICIRDALLKYHKESYKTEISEISEIFDIINK
jgi:hypothetical protein